MSWLQITFETSESQTQIISDLLSELGALAVTLEDAADQPLFEPPPGETPMWSQSRVTGLFNADVDMEQIVSAVKESLHPEPLPPWRSSPLEDKDWEREWMDSFKPIQFGKRLWIVPSWHDAPDQNAVNILLDPGLAFGTGTHATTSLCLQWLDEHLLESSTVIDFGCGSGILAIAAIKLGARHVIAIDNDPQALIATKANAEKNAVTDLIEVKLPSTAITQGPVDILLANILAQPLIELSSQLAQFVKTGGDIVLSGILQKQAQNVINAYTPFFDMDSEVSKDDWVRLHGKRL